MKLVEGAQGRGRGGGDVKRGATGKVCGKRTLPGVWCSAMLWPQSSGRADLRIVPRAALTVKMQMGWLQKGIWFWSSP